MKHRSTFTIALFASALSLSSCGDSSSSQVDVVNLDKVLDTFVATADAMPAPPAEEGQEQEAALGTPEKVKVFTESYARSLNDQKIMSKPVGVTMRPDGAFLGFSDPNSNGTKDSGENEIFTVQVDSANSRLIATDVQNSYNRDKGYRMGGGGFLTGYLVGSMIGGQRRAGINPGRFSSMKVEPKGYHSKAAKTVRSARSSSGSRSFRSGK